MRFAGRALVVAGMALATMPACAGSPCIDGDGDGYGENCAKGKDCDDSDSARSASCATVDCDVEPRGQGCPCQGSAAQACFAGQVEATTYGACRAGTQYCVVGQWSACEGEIAPRNEACNGEDDDCDGRIDEGALSPCGGCDSHCVGAVWGSDEFPFVESKTLVVTDAGVLTLAFEALSHHIVWVANTDERTLSRVDADGLVETARYAMPGEPFRVATDYEGSAFVLSQSDSDWHLTKVAGGKDLCVDQLGDGLNTSQGDQDVLSLGDDDCVLWSTAVADASGAVLALAVDGTRVPDGPAGGDPWVGSAVPAQMRRYSGISGVASTRVKLPAGALPHDAAFDPLGRLWVADQRGELLSLVYRDGRYRVTAYPAPTACRQLEALTVDDRGRPVMSTFSCESVLRFEPSSSRFLEAMAPGLLSTRGVAVLGDAVFVVHTAAALSRLATETLAFEQTVSLEGSLGEPVETVGLAADGMDSLWITSRQSRDSQLGLLTRVDSSSLEITGQLEVGEGPRALGDFAGGRLLGSYASQGSIRQRFSGCPDGTPTRWQAVHVRYLGAEGAEIEVAARRADTRAGLSSESFTVVGVTPADPLPFSLGSLERGGALELRLTLRSKAHIGAPAISQLGVQWACEGPN